MDGGAEPERAVVCPEGPRRRAKGKRRAAMRACRQVGKREQGRCQQHAARKQPPFARHALLKLTLEQGAVRQFLSHGRECQTPQWGQAARREQQPDAPEQESQPDPPIPERADKTADVQRLPYLPPYFFHSDTHPLKGDHAVTCARESCGQGFDKHKKSLGMEGMGKGRKGLPPFPNLKETRQRPASSYFSRRSHSPKFAGFFQILTGPFRLAQQETHVAAIDARARQIR